MAKVTIFLTPELRGRIERLSVRRGLTPLNATRTLVEYGGFRFSDGAEQQILKDMERLAAGAGHQFDIDIDPFAKERLDHAFVGLDIINNPAVTEPGALGVFVGNVLDKTSDGDDIPDDWWAGPNISGGGKP